MKREDCWMTFTEALEQYLRAREVLKFSLNISDIANAQLECRDATEHMNVLTGDVK